MKIVFVASDLTDLETSGIRALLTDTANHLNQFLRDPFIGTIPVQGASPHPKAPITLNLNSRHDPIRIHLKVKGTRWNQYVFQFAHEFCHVLTDHYESLLGNPNSWLHETMCEIASIFCLRRMAGQWLHCPSIPGTETYAKKFSKYSDNRLSTPEAHLPPGVTLPNWILSHQKELRTENVAQDDQRVNQALIAYILLPIFENHTQGWNTITKFPTSSTDLASYLQEWHSLVDPNDRAFIVNLSEVLGYKLHN